MLLVRLVSSPLKRNFSTSLRLTVRRARQRQEVGEEVEDVEVGGKWLDFVRRGRDVTEERLRVTSFGSMRVDSENIPVIHGQHERLVGQEKELEEREPEKKEVVGEAHLVQNTARPGPLLDSLLEDDGTSNSNYVKYKQFSVKSNSEQDENRVEKQNFAFGKRIDNRTIVPPLDSDGDIGEGGSSDLNLIDKAVFGSAFSSFNPDEAKMPRQVTVDPSVEVARQAVADPDLNLIDQEYFAPASLSQSPHFDPTGQEHVSSFPNSSSPQLCQSKPSSRNSEDYPLTNNFEDSSQGCHNQTSPSEDLGFIDEQFFKPLNTSQAISPSSEKNQNEQLLGRFESHSKQQSSDIQNEFSPPKKTASSKWFQTNLDLPEKFSEEIGGKSEPSDLLKYSEKLELEQKSSPTLQSEEKFRQKASESFDSQRMTRENLKAEATEKRKTKKKAKTKISPEEPSSAERRKQVTVLDELNNEPLENLDTLDTLPGKKGSVMGRGHKKPGGGGAALEYVRKLRKMEEQASTGPVFPLGTNLQDRLMAATTHLKPTARLRGSVEEEEEGSKEKELYHVKRYRPPDLTTYTSLEMQELLASKVIYNKHDIVALWKPYGMTMFHTQGQGDKRRKEKDEVTRRMLAIETYLPHIANKLGCSSLYEVHRLDATTTGVLLYAKTTAMRDTLKKLLAQRKVEKTYLAITNGVPKALEGIVDIPVGEGQIGDRFRMTLRPDYNSENSRAITNKKTSQRERLAAVTDYKVLSSFNSAALVQCNMSTGRKHQIRLHLGLGLGTPILGDHKYSYPDILDKPQRVKGDIVARLRIQPSKARDLPLFLHARRIIIPGILPERDLVITANLPHFITRTMKRLRLKADKTAERKNS